MPAVASRSAALPCPGASGDGASSTRTRSTGLSSTTSADPLMLSMAIDAMAPCSQMEKIPDDQALGDNASEHKEPPGTLSKINSGFSGSSVVMRTGQVVVMGSVQSLDFRRQSDRELYEACLPLWGTSTPSYLEVLDFERR